MAFDKVLDSRVAAYALPLGAVRKAMFGGTGYMLNGNMMAGVHRERLVVRLSSGAGERALQDPGVAPFDITGKPMAGWVTIHPDELSDEALERWLDAARAYADSLPPK